MGYEGVGMGYEGGGMGYEGVGMGYGGVGIGYEGLRMRYDGIAEHVTYLPTSAVKMTASSPPASYPTFSASQTWRRRSRSSWR